MGRPREVGSEKWATVSEAAEALGVTYQAIRNRMNAGTIPYEQHVEGSRPHYRIRRDWLDREVKRKKDGTPATVEDAHDRTQDLLTAYEAGIAVIAGELRDAKDAIRREIEIQHTQVVPLLETLIGLAEVMREAQAKQGGENQQIISNQQEFFKLLRRVIARAEEEDRREAEYQSRNLAIQEENQRLQREVLEVHQRLAEQLGRVEEAERERAERGRQERAEQEQPERRSFWRRFFSP